MHQSLTAEPAFPPPSASTTIQQAQHQLCHSSMAYRPPYSFSVLTLNVPVTQNILLLAQSAHAPNPPLHLHSPGPTRRGGLHAPRLRLRHGYHRGRRRRTINPSWSRDVLHHQRRLRCGSCISSSSAPSLPRPRSRISRNATPRLRP